MEELFRTKFLDQAKLSVITYTRCQAHYPQRGMAKRHMGDVVVKYMYVYIK